MGAQQAATAAGYQGLFALWQLGVQLAPTCHCSSTNSMAPCPCPCLLAPPHGLAVALRVLGVTFYCQCPQVCC